MEKWSSPKDAEGQGNMPQKLFALQYTLGCTSAYFLTLADGLERMKHGVARAVTVVGVIRNC